MKPSRGHRRSLPDRATALAAVVRGGGRSVVMQVLGLGLGYAVHVLLARWMGAADYGAYTYVVTWAALLAIPAGSGLPILVIRFVPEYIARAAWGHVRGVLRWSGRQVLLAGTVLALAALAVVGLLGDDVAGAYTRPFLIGVWLIPLQALLNVLSGIYQGVHRVGRAHSLAALRHGLVLALAFALWQAGAALTSVEALGITVAAAGGVLALHARPLLQALPQKARTAAPAYEPRTWRRVALPLMLVAGFVLLLHHADVLVVGSLLGPRAAGLYRAASKTAGLIGIGFTAAVAAAGPAMVRLYTEGAQAELQRLASGVAHWLFWPSLLLTLALILAARPALRLFGPEFVEARGVLIVLALGHLANAGAGIGATVLNLTGHHDWGAAVFGWSALLNVVLNVVGVALLGLLGAALATAFTLLLQGILFTLLTRRKLHLDPSIAYALRHLGRRET